MRNLLPLLPLTILLTACAAGEDTNAPDWVAGIYTGNFTPANGAAAQPSVVMITSNNKALYTETDVQSTGLGTVNAATVSFGSQASMSLTDGLSGTYDFGGVSGSFSLVASDVYSHGSSSARLNGVYIDDTYTSVAGISTWTFANGLFSVTSSSGCTASGSILPIDTTYNEYTVNLTMQDCGNYTDVYTGLAFTDNTNSADDTINILIENASKQILIFSAPVLQ